MNVTIYAENWELYRNCNIIKPLSTATPIAALCGHDYDTVYVFPPGGANHDPEVPVSPPPPKGGDEYSERTFW